MPPKRDPASRAVRGAATRPPPVRRCWYWFSYCVAARELRRQASLDIHKLRDGGTVLDLAPALFSAGFQYGGLVLNLPPALCAGSAVDTQPALHPGDILLLPTRTPLDDTESEAKRQIDRSETSLEATAHAAMRRLFSKLDRTRAILSPEVRQELPIDQQQYAEAHFTQYRGAHVQHFAGGARAPAGLTAVYLACVPGDAFRLVAAFGMSGAATLIWGWLLRTVFDRQFRSALNESGRRLLIATFSLPSKTFPYPYVNFDLNQLDARIVVDVRL